MRAGTTFSKNAKKVLRHVQEICIQITIFQNFLRNTNATSILFHSFLYQSFVNLGKDAFLSVEIASIVSNRNIL